MKQLRTDNIVEIRTDGSGRKIAEYDITRRVLIIRTHGERTEIPLADLPKN